MQIHGSNKEVEANIDEVFVYKIGKLEELIAEHFLNYKENKHIEFTAIIKLSNDLIKEALSNETNLDSASNKSFHIIITLLFIPIEARL
ncbi:1711_t:CDS:2 [Cetraspora pellucida]|uniref:1711_t:CDS:1 n=1 Tax=Cetraspora pellucida TaxID=1433469 RepID=A0A9N9EC54_9GLOM|nr:1711_t:CDS:2 [Cetraspora pellucida]